MKLICLIKHKWELISVKTYSKEYIERTDVEERKLYKCKRCDKTKEVSKNKKTIQY